ncbi:TetR/AcrR family transcriptional regulator [Pseudomonas sp. Hp2]|uniref:TetR/AcrR family transcriptional regulator n=1 Tax=Pseudomonas sp. Hp2 TaxID=701189 RepID=UPI00112B0ECE|nr:TetR/AcrR family transcriptional regulator [Pseudomonas sp. Hp2]
MTASTALHLPSDERDRRVREAVHALLAEQGMRLSMDAVAARAGCAKQTLYARYGSKQNLLRQVMQEYTDLITAHLAADGPDLRAGLLAFAREHLDQLNRPETIRISQLIEAESSRFPEQARRIYRDGVAGLQHRLADWLRAAMDRGQLSSHDDPHFMAELLLGMIVGLDFERRRFHMPHRATARERQRWAEFAVDSFLRTFSASDFPHSNL